MKTSILPLLGIAALCLPGITLAGPDDMLMTTLQCHTENRNSQRMDWKIQLDESLPLAIVDDNDTPADYSASHIRVRLAANGPSLVIGRVSGRIVLSATDGTTLAVGHCTAPLHT